MTPKEWIEKYKSFLKDETIHRLLSNDGLPINKFKSWTFLKLAVLYSYIHFIYLPHIGKNYENPIYIDLFAGSGVSFDTENKILYVGSPIIAATNETSGYHFKKCIFVEKNEKYASALQQRLEILKNNDLIKCEMYTVITGDCNDPRIIRRVMNLIPRAKKHVMLFVDPYGIKFYKSTLDAFINKPYLYFDMFFNFQNHAAARLIKKGTNTLTQLFGKKIWWAPCQDTNEKVYDCLLNRYIEMLKKEGKGKINTVMPIKVNSGMGYGYTLLFTTRKEDAEWLTGVNHLKDVAEELTGMTITTLEKTTTLEDFSDEKIKGDKAHT